MKGRNPDGPMHFIGRRKGVIHRSGRNLPAPEVEAVLPPHPLLAQTAVLATHDGSREAGVPRA